MTFIRCDRTEAWAALAGHFEAHGRTLDLREAFARDPGRFNAMGIEAPEVFADLSKNLIDTATLHFLLDLRANAACWSGATPCSAASRSTRPRAGP